MNAACKWYGARPGPCCALRAGGQGAGKPVLASYVRACVPPAYLAFYVFRGGIRRLCMCAACLCVGGGVCTWWAWGEPECSGRARSTYVRSRGLDRLATIARSAHLVHFHCTHGIYVYGRAGSTPCHLGYPALCSHDGATIW